jgi:hypothetical protein
VDDNHFKSIREVMSDFILELQTHFDFEVAAEDHLPHSFGNSYVDLQSPKLCLRITRDRNQIFFEVASPDDPKNLHDVRIVLDYLGMQEARAVLDLGLTGQTAAPAEVVKEKMSAIADVLNEPRKLEFMEFKKQQARQRFPGRYRN